MPITRQVYEWRLTGANITTANDIPVAGQPFSIFVGPFGESNRKIPTNGTQDPRNKTEYPPFVNEDTFVVIDDFRSTPGVLPNYTVAAGVITDFVPNGFIQIVIDTTGYYQDPADVYDLGISGDAAQYPWTGYPLQKHQYRLRPPLYVLPEQTWDVRYTMLNDLRTTFAAGGVTVSPSLVLARCFVQYHLFTGADALICHRLLALGIPVTVDNVEWFKRQLLSSQHMETHTFEYYLRVSQAYRDRERERDKHYGRGRIKTTQEEPI